MRVENELAEDVAQTLHVGLVGSELYAAQEGAHDTFTYYSGEEIEHYYIYFCVGSECVPVDPFELGG